VTIRCIWLVPLFGCQTKAETPAVDPTVMVEVRDGKSLVASLRPGRPCRATIGPTEMIIGGPPLISQLGDVRWSGAEGSNGTTLEREGDRVARIFPVNDQKTVSVFDLTGVPMLRVQATADGATVTDASLTPLRTLSIKGAQILVDEPGSSRRGSAAEGQRGVVDKLVITGTHDVLLASVLTAPELSPEIRMLAACERVLVTEKKEL
jgi:hypothetical protein